MRYLKRIEQRFSQIFKFLSDSSGVVAVESAFIFPALILLCGGLLDYGLYLDRKGRVEAVNGSLISVLRERTHLYADEDRLTNAQIVQLTALAEVILGKASKTGFCLTAEAIIFKDDPIKKPQVTQIFYGGANGCKQKPTLALSKHQAMSPWSIRARWLPLYQLTLSLPAPSGTFSSLLTGTGMLPDKIVVSNIALRR